MTSIIRWDANPEIFRVGFFALRWYGILFAIAFYSAYRFLRHVYVQRKAPIHHLDQLLAFMVAGTLIGARLGHTLFYEPDIYLADPIRILRIWEGGLASHGAAAGIILSLFLYCRKYGYPFLWLADRVCIPAALSGFFIRTGNLFNSEIIGKPTDGSWGVIFTHVDPQRPRHPTQVYEALGYLAIFLLLNHLYRKKTLARREGMLLGLFMILVFGFRFFIEFFKENQVAYEGGLPLNLGQLLSLPVVLAGVLLVARAARRPPEPAGGA